MYLAVFAGSFALSAVLVWVSIGIAHRYAFYDHPDLERKTQTTPIPRLGGLAVAIGFTIASATTLLVVREAADALLFLGILLPALGAAFLGFLDDRRPLNPWMRLAVQALLAAAVWATGTRIDLTGNTAIDAMILILWIMAIINGINFLDNSDGLAGSTVVLAAGSAGVIAAVNGQYLVAALGYALAGIAAGFLLHNWHPAKVYLGDSGAYFVGFLVAVLAVRLKPVGLSLPLSALIPVLLLVLPLADTTFVVITRLLDRKHPFTAGRDHLSHRLQDRGLSIPMSVVSLQAILAVGCLAAFTLAVVI
jgi:UDP-GlcNAc:undecaprenyl-phosphate GlcNAc-1-phosphate transferase